MSKGETGSSHITHSSAPWIPNNPLCGHLTFLLATQHPKPFLCLGNPPPSDHLLWRSQKCQKLGFP